MSGVMPELYAPGIVNTEAIEFNGVLSPDGREFFFARHVAGVDTMFHSVFADGRWSEPLRLSAFPGDVSGGLAVSPRRLWSSASWASTRTSSPPRMI